MKNEWTFGLEIEGMTFEKHYDKIKKTLKQNKKKFPKGEGGFVFTCDDTIEIDDELMDLAYTKEYDAENIIEEIIPFEIKLGPFTYKEETNSILKSLLLELGYFGLSSNSSCSVHLHVKPKQFELYSNGAHWASNLLLAYLIETKKYKYFLKHRKREMSHPQWASVENMIEEYQIMKQNFKDNPNLFFEPRKPKYVMRGLFHAHSQGTLEWRGNRGMFDMNPVLYVNNYSQFFLQSIKQQMDFILSIFPVLDQAMSGDSNNNMELYSNLLEMKNAF